MAARRWLSLLNAALLLLVAGLRPLEAQTANRFAGTFDEVFSNGGKVTPIFTRPDAPALPTRIRARLTNARRAYPPRSAKAHHPTPAVRVSMDQGLSGACWAGLPGPAAAPGPARAQVSWPDRVASNAHRPLELLGALPCGGPGPRDTPSSRSRCLRRVGSTRPV